MDPSHIVLILLAGVVVGWINNLAGAAGAIGLVVFVELLGMPDMVANASIRPAALAIGIGGMIGFLSKQQKIPGRMWGYALLTIPGAILGSHLVEDRFTLLFQLTLATLLVLVLVQQIANRTGQAKPGVETSESDPGQQDLTTRKDTPAWLLLVLFSWLGAHMGFIQVATGLVSIFILSIVHSRDLVQVNAAKMVFVVVAALTSNVTLAIKEQIDWAPALTLASGAGVGSFLASRWSVRKGHAAVRWVVVGICVAVLAHLGYRMLA